MTEERRREIRCLADRIEDALRPASVGDTAADRIAIEARARTLPHYRVQMADSYLRLARRLWIDERIAEMVRRWEMTPDPGGAP